MALEEENASCKKLLEQTTDLVNTLKVCIILILYFTFLSEYVYK